MMVGAFRYRLPPAGWRPEGWTPPPASQRHDHHSINVHLNDAHKTPQFWLIWWVLTLNVSAGIGVIGMASPMLQEIFAGKLIGHPELGFNALDARQKVAIAGIAAGFAGLLSLFNIGGRFFWASLSDYIGRKNTYFTFFVLGIVCYCLVPWSADRQRRRCSSLRRRASSCRCTAAASPPCRPISPTCSARSSSAPSTAGC